MKVEIIYFNAGGGHRSAAKALNEVMAQSHGWEVTLTNLFDVLDPKGLFKRVTGNDYEELYNKVLASGFTMWLEPQLRVMQAGINLQRNAMIKKLRAHWAVTNPDVVVSVIPNFNRAIGESVTAPFFTIMTDICDLPPNFWVEPKLENQHIIVGSEAAAAQALASGVRASHVHRVSGMVLRSAFYEPATTEVRPLRGLVMFGGIGSKDMLPIAKSLADRELILVCGENKSLHAKLCELKNPKHQVLGFVQDVPQLMRGCQYFIGKPGPGSISEALHLGLPVIVPHNSWTMPQERWNAEWVRQQGLGIVVKSFKQVQSTVDELISRLPELQANIARFEKNNAVFEIPKVISEVVGSA